jgi:hypothetical protein
MAEALSAVRLPSWEWLELRLRAMTRCWCGGIGNSSAAWRARCSLRKHFPAARSIAAVIRTAAYSLIAACPLCWLPQASKAARRHQRDQEQQADGDHSGQPYRAELHAAPSKKQFVELVRH